jgi:hypothetical protein
MSTRNCRLKFPLSLAQFQAPPIQFPLKPKADVFAAQKTRRHCQEAEFPGSDGLVPWR